MQPDDDDPREGNLDPRDKPKNGFPPVAPKPKTPRSDPKAEWVSTKRVDSEKQ